MFKRLVSLGLVLTGLLAALGLGAATMQPSLSRGSARAVSATSEIIPTPPTPMAFAAATPPPEAAAVPEALLVDMRSGQTLYAREADRRFLPASVTKVMTAYTAFDLLSRGRLRADQLMSVSDGAWREWHAKGSRMFLDRGALVSVDQLLLGITTVSANDACIVLAEGTSGSVDKWVALMNAEARSLGMNDSHFGTPNGWMDQGNTYYSARDLVKLANAMIRRYPAYYHRYFGHAALTWNGITQRNHDPTVGVVAGADGIKTGFTDEARYNFLGSATRDGRRLVMVLASVPTARERAKAARALLEWGFSAWAERPLFAAGARLATAEVQGGAADSVDLIAPQAVYATLPNGASLPAKLRIVYKGPVPAPIHKGEEIAELEVRVGDQEPGHLPLVAAKDVAKGGVISRLRDGFSGWLQ